MPSTIQPSEVAFVLVALCGLAVWLRNRMLAGWDRKAANTQAANTLSGDAAMFARYQILETRILMAAQLITISIGALLMAYPPNPAGSLVTRWTIAGGVIAISLLNTYLGLRWRSVAVSLVFRARQRRIAAREE